VRVWKEKNWKMRAEEGSGESSEGSEEGMPVMRRQVAPLPAHDVSDIVAFCQKNFYIFSQTTRENIVKLFTRSAFSPKKHIQDVQKVVFSDKVLVRAALRDVQRASVSDASSEAWPLRGAHATTNPGIIGILKDRRLRAMNFAGVYCMMYKNAWTIEHMKELMSKVSGGKRDYAGVVVELSSVSKCARLKSGGIPADEEWCKKGFVAHQRPEKGGGEDRWLVPENQITMEALWFVDGCLEGIDVAQIFGI